MAEGPIQLAPYAASGSTSRGRSYREDRPAYRGEFQRDRDRIIHSTAFRRLVYKTQVFVNHVGDLYRTRLTHSLEVAQISRTIARVLGLNEHLVEAVALAHDLGHTPFGHAGQTALNRCMRAHGGFEHNLQSLRVVDSLEEKYADFPGLNLTFETREGILKHCARTRAEQLGEVGRRFLEGTQPSLEAQLANLADEIAYNNHDVDDGLRSGLLEVEVLAETELFGSVLSQVRALHPDIQGRRLIHEIVRRMIDRMVTDLIETSRSNIELLAPGDIEAVRARAEPLMAYSTEMRRQVVELKRFLRRNLYTHPRVQAMTERARETVSQLFAVYSEDPTEMPDEHRRRLEASDDRSGALRVVADYVAGMTDRFALSEQERLSGG